MIVVVEGASGAGKTTWCRTHGGPYALLEELPDHSKVPTESEAAARFWVERNVARWAQVLKREQSDALVVVDVDPFKASLRLDTVAHRPGATARMGSPARAVAQSLQRG